jgi:hypothetical protein
MLTKFVSSRLTVRPDEGLTLNFLRRVPKLALVTLADDLKLLLGWTADASASGTLFRGGEVVDAGSGYFSVPGFAPPTNMRSLHGRYRILRPPFKFGIGYYGLAFAALSDDGSVYAIVLANRLFRMPVMLREPVGLLTDILSNLAMFAGLDTPALEGARTAAAETLKSAETAGVPMIIVGPSQAGAMAQLQIMTLQAERPEVAKHAGFITFNAAYPILWPFRLGIPEEMVQGVNFSKDLDPGFGPTAPVENRIGTRLYVHRDGTVSETPGHENYFNAWYHSRQHFLDTFTDVPLSAALAAKVGSLFQSGSCDAS